jgi:hypothetical protein
MSMGILSAGMLWIYLKFTDFNFLLCSLIAVALVCMYNGKQGAGMKWFFYAFYPAHITGLVLAKYMI